MNLIENISNVMFPEREIKTLKNEKIYDFKPETFDMLTSTIESSERTIETKNGMSNIIYKSNSVLSGRGTLPVGKKKARLGSDYDLSKAERFYEKDGTIRKYAAMAASRILRAKFNVVPNKNFIGRDGDKLHKLTVNRLDEILYNSNLTWPEIIQTIGKEVYVVGNSFILKNRENNKGSINKIILDDPIFYDAIVDVQDMSITHYTRKPHLRKKPHSNLRNKTLDMLGLGGGMGSSLGFDMFGGGGISIQRQKEQRLSASQVIHFRYMIEKNAPFCMPPIMAVAIDIEDLRTLEESMVALAWQYGNPILHVTVDTSRLSEADAATEVGRAIEAVEHMKSIGFLATTSRVTMKMHYPNGTAIPIEKFVNHLNGRITSSLDTAALLLGDGGSAGRQAGEAIEAASNDAFNMIAMIIAKRLEIGLIRDIYNDIGGPGITPATCINIIELDRNRKAARENVLVNGVNVGAIERDELREILELPPLTKEQTKKIDSYFTTRKGDTFKTVNPSNQKGDTTPGSTTN